MDESEKDESILQDIQNLNKFNEEQFNELCTLVFTFLIDPSKVDQFHKQLDEFIETHNTNPSSLRSIVKLLIHIPNNALKSNKSEEEFRTELQNLGFSQTAQDVFYTKWKNNSNALKQIALEKTLTINQLVDLEWKFGVTAASSESDKIGTTFLQLKLVINRGNKLENVFMELSLPQFYSFLHEMERAKASLDYLS